MIDSVVPTAGLLVQVDMYLSDIGTFAVVGCGVGVFVSVLDMFVVVTGVDVSGGVEVTVVADPFDLTGELESYTILRSVTN